MSGASGDARLQVQFTIDDRARGESIVAALLRQRLIACAQTVGPVTSRYRWQGSIEETQEWLFVCKTTAARVDAVIESVRAQHPYEVPEIVASEIAAGFEPYLVWIADETS